MKTKHLTAGLLSAAMLCQPMTSFAKYGYPGETKTIAGDVNDDGNFNIADVVTLQKWLVGEGELGAPLNADFYEDGVIDVFDLCLMQNELIESLAIPSPLYSSRNLCSGYEPEDVGLVPYDQDFIAGQTAFALNLFKQTLKEDSNTLISPYSATYALSMTANGADGQTLKEMEDVLCGGMSIDELNKYLYTQSKSEARTMYSTTSVDNTNSIWIRPDIDVSADFIKKNVDYYGSEIFSSPMDESTVNEVNQWVEKNTHDMIHNMLRMLPPNTTMLLINALAFEGKWEGEFAPAVKDNFTAYDGTVQEADMMSSHENYFISDENATGFIKGYEGDYSFVALLPNEGVSVEEYINSLDAESFNSMLKNRIFADVTVKMPKFDFDDDMSLKDYLIAMGMPTAFDNYKADFSRMTEDKRPMFISEVLQKTHIEVDEKGTKAAAATVVIMAENGIAPMPQETKEVILDRPFVFAIVNNRTNLPLFIGAVQALE